MPYLAWLYLPSFHKAQGLQQMIMFSCDTSAHKASLPVQVQNFEFAQHPYLCPAELQCVYEAAINLPHSTRLAGIFPGTVINGRLALHG